MIVVILGGSVVGAVTGVIIGDSGLAIFAPLMCLVGGVAALRLGPIIKPPSPSVVVKPPTGSSRAARGRRRAERIGVLAMGTPLVGLLVFAAIVAPDTGARLGFLAAALALLALYGRAFWLIGNGTEASDRRRSRVYDRQVGHLTEDRRWYEANIDPANQRRRVARAGKWYLGLMLAPMALLVMIIPALLTEQSSSSAVRAGGSVISGALLVLALAAIVVWAARRRAAPPAD